MTACSSSGALAMSSSPRGVTTTRSSRSSMSMAKGSTTSMKRGSLRTDARVMRIARCARTRLGTPSDMAETQRTRQQAHPVPERGVREGEAARDRCSSCRSSSRRASTRRRSRSVFRTTSRRPRRRRAASSGASSSSAARPRRSSLPGPGRRVRRGRPRSRASANKALAAAKGPVAGAARHAPQRQPAAQPPRRLLERGRGDRALQPSSRRSPSSSATRTPSKLAREYRRQEERMQTFVSQAARRRDKDVIKAEVPKEERPTRSSSRRRSTSRSASSRSRSTASSSRAKSSRAKSRRFRVAREVERLVVAVRGPRVVVAVALEPASRARASCALPQRASCAKSTRRPK